VVCCTWYVVHGMWYVVHGMWYVVHGMLYMVCGMLYMVCGMLYMVCGKKHVHPIVGEDPISDCLIRRSAPFRLALLYLFHYLMIV